MKLKSINIITIYLRAYPSFVGCTEISPALNSGRFLLFIIAAPAAILFLLFIVFFNIRIKDNIIAYL